MLLAGIYLLQRLCATRFRGRRSARSDQYFQTVRAEVSYKKVPVFRCRRPVWTIYSFNEKTSQSYLNQVVTSFLKPRKGQNANVAGRPFSSVAELQMRDGKLGESTVSLVV